MTALERYRAALELIAMQTLPAHDGGAIAGAYGDDPADELARFAQSVLDGPVPHDDCPYCRGDASDGCPACFVEPEDTV